MPRQPPEVQAGRPAATVRLHRDPLGFLRGTQAAIGDVFGLTLATCRSRSGHVRGRVALRSAAHIERQPTAWQT
jgi:hypothetical protein